VPILVPMSLESFGGFAAKTVASYAEQNVLSGRWPPERALECAKAEHERLLPQGMATPGHFFFEIHDAEGTSTVGGVWLGLTEKDGVRMAHVLDVRINEEHRRQGHAKRALLALEQFVRSQGVHTIGLNVFAHNTGARALYESLGYSVTGLINMQKEIGCLDA